jgi:hypothetical protein
MEIATVSTSLLGKAVLAPRAVWPTVTPMEMNLSMVQI